VETVTRFFPPEAYLEFTAMSEHALVFSTETYAHRTLVVYEDGGLWAEQVRTVEDILKLNELELWRLRHQREGSQPRRVLAEPVAAGWRPPPVPETVYPITEEGGSWREHCEAAMAGDSGSDAEEQW
jgi:hypothetical protein